MFKKPSEVKALQRLSGADRKKLRRSLRDKFQNLSESDVDIILPPKAEVTVTKLASRVHVYAVDGGPPLLFDVDGRGADILPTVFTLWKLPAFLQAFVLKGAEVSRYVLGGADLMFPGVTIPAEGFSFNSGEPWAVKVPGNEFPIAVGITTMSGVDATKAGFRGKALRIMHYYLDTLWEFAEGRYVPNSGFLGDIVIEDAPLVAPADQHESQDTDTSEAAEREEISLGVKDMNISEEDTAAAAVAVTSTSCTTEEMDVLLDNCLLQALHTNVKDKDLPMPASSLWSGHILPCRPPNSMLDIKKSSHKKLSKWLQAKSSAGLISAKEDKHRKEMLLTGVNRGHPDYQSFKPDKLTVTEVASGVAAKDSSHSLVDLELTDVWKPTSHVTPIFEAMGADTSKYYNAAEAREVVHLYVEKEQLVKGGAGAGAGAGAGPRSGSGSGKGVVVLNAVLCDALYKGVVKKGSSYPTEIEKKDLGDAFIARMQAYHVVRRGKESVVRKGNVKCVQIMTERRQGNKKVTRVWGMESFMVDADMLSAELQKKFACSTSVAELAGKKGCYEVLVQGGVLEELAMHLVQSHGIPKRYVEILDKTKKL